MNDIRRTILWVIFGFSLVMLWDQWQLHNGRPATFFPVPTASSAASAASARQRRAQRRRHRGHRAWRWRTRDRRQAARVD